MHDDTDRESLAVTLDVFEELLQEAVLEHFKNTGRDGSTVTQKDANRVLLSHVVYACRVLGGSAPEGDYYHDMVEKMLAVTAGKSHLHALYAASGMFEAGVRLQAKYITQGLFDAEE